LVQPVELGSVIRLIWFTRLNRDAFGFASGGVEDIEPTS